MPTDMLILGCGWAGVLAARRVGGICLDKDFETGGLLKSVTLNGFTIDAGGTHIIYSRDSSVLAEMLRLLKDNIVSHERAVYVMLGSTLVPYPLENGLYVLPPEDRAEALISFFEVLISMGEGWKPRNFEEWIRSFGKWIANKYLLPYNKKLWKRQLSEIDVDWVYTPGRLPVPDWRSVVKSAVGLPTVGYSEQARFYYPLKGGIQALYNAAREKAQENGAVFKHGEAIEFVKAVGGLVVNGRYRAKKLISTIPLPELIHALEGTVHDDLKDFASRFDWNSVAVVAVALNREAPPVHWVYVPDESVVFHRYIWVSNYSPYNAPKGKSLLIAEVTAPPSQKVDEKLIDKVIEDLTRLGVVEEKDVLFAKMYFHHYGYPIHKIGTAEARRYVSGYLKRLGILTAGRWGTWKYLNMDMVMKQINELIP